ncbi:MAG: PTS sugar transporter subunit IIA [Clostridiaceae bacterium]
MLSELLTEENIRFLPAAADWHEAVRLCAEPLLESGAITARYAEAMVQSVELHGPYIVVDEGLALPHARPEDGAVRPGMAMLILERPVDLLGQSVWVFVALAAADANAHLDALKELAELVWNGGTARVLASLGTPVSVTAYIKEHTVQNES